MTRILVNHLTRMQHPRICVAGLDLNTNEHIRPVLQKGQLDTSMLAANSGPFALGGIVDLGTVLDVSSPPEIEDRSFDQTAARLRTQLNGSQFWKAIDNVAVTDLNEIFGDKFEETSRSFSTPEGEGSHSLGCYRPSNTPAIATDSYGGKLSVHAYIPWGKQVKRVPITDLRVVEADFTVSAAKVDRLQKLVAAAPDILLSVGLSRAFRASGANEKRHWLQVNNVFLAQDPLWK